MADLGELVKKIGAAADEEFNASAEYREMRDKALELGQTELAEVLNEIATDEFWHNKRLRAIEQALLEAWRG